MNEKGKRGETNVGDYVDRSELFHKMRTIYREEGNVMIPHRVVTYSDLILTPAADVAPVVHGWWVEKDDAAMHCNRCDRAGNPHIDNYCPNCGAKMDKEPPKEE